MSDLAPTPVVHRHRTAMVRHDLSQPVGFLVRHGLVRPGISVFDYGCGQGDDIRILSAQGISAQGWDPHFRSESAKVAAEVVNLGFVLNVIERPQERVDALLGAWALTTRVLAVATMIAGQVPTSSLRPLGDGFLTSRGTFQKYYDQSELRALIAQTLRVTPVAVAPGIFLAFRNPEDEQDFLLERRAGRRLSAAAYRIPRPPRPRVRPLKPALPERIPLALEAIRDFALRRGRFPAADELDVPALEELSAEKVGLPRALQCVVDAGLDEQQLAAAAAARREDLLVHYALAALNRDQSAARPSPAMVRDIRFLFGSQKEVTVQAHDYLHQLADAERMSQIMHEAAAAGVGALDQRARLVVYGDRAESLPGLLRCYFGCATILAGEPAGPFLFRIDPTRRRVTMWPLPTAEANFPVTSSSIQIDLSRRAVRLRPDRRRVLRLAELQGLSPRTKRRRSEASVLSAAGVAPHEMFQKLNLEPAAKAGPRASPTGTVSQRWSMPPVQPRRLSAVNKASVMRSKAPWLNLRGIGAGSRA